MEQSKDWWKQYILIIEDNDFIVKRMSLKVDLVLNKHDPSREKLNVLFAKTKEKAIEFIDWNTNLTSVILDWDLWHWIEETCELIDLIRRKYKNKVKIFSNAWNDEFKLIHIRRWADTCIPKGDTWFILNLLMIIWIYSLLQEFDFTK